MATTIDEKIVKLTLDNDSFSDNAALAITQLSALDKTSLTNIDSSLNTVASSFSTMSIIGITAISTLTTKVVDGMIDIVSALSIDQFTAGFSQYEAKLQSTLTLQTALGKNANDIIQENLDELEAYANLTTYSVGDMQQALAGFVNAGVDIDLAAVAIQGMGNVSASAGVSVSRFASVMQTAVTQSMSMGYMSYENWRQLQDAGVATARLKEELLTTYTTMTGEELDSSTAFNSALTEQQWLTNDILNTTLARLAVDEELLSAAQDFVTFSQVSDATFEAVKTGWSDIFQALFGSLDETRELWTPIGNAAIAAVQAPLYVLRDIAAEFKSFGGVDNTIEALGNIFSSFGKIIGVVSDALATVFPINFGKELAENSEGFLAFSEAISPSEETLEMLSSVLVSVLSIVKTGVSYVTGFASAILNLVSQFISLEDIINVLKAGLGYVQTFFSSISESSGARGITDNIQSLEIMKMSVIDIEGAVETFGSVIGTIFTFIQNLLSNGKDNFSDFGSTTEKELSGVGDIFDDIKESLSKFLDAVKNIPQYIEPAIAAFEAFFGPLTLNNILVKAGAITTIYSIYSAFKSLSSLTGTFNTFVKSMTGVFDSVSGGIDAWKNQTNAKTLLYVAAAIAILAVSIKLLTTIPEDELKKALLGTAALLALVAAELFALSKIDGVKSSLTLIAIAASVLILAYALEKLVGIEDISSGLIRLTAILILLTASIAAMSFGSDTKIVKAAATIVALAIAVAAMTAVLAILGNMDMNTLVQGGVAIGLLLAALTVFSATAGDGGAKVLTTSLALIVLVAAVKSLGSMDTGTLVKGAAAISVLLISIGVATKLLNGTNIVSASAGITLMSIGVYAIASALMVLSSIDSSKIILGTVALAALLGVMAVVATMSSNALLGAAAMAIMTVSILGITFAIQTLGAMDPLSIVIALGTLAVALVGLVALGALMAPMAIGLVVVSAAIITFSVALITLSVAMSVIGFAILSFTTSMLMIAGLANTFPDATETIKAALSAFIDAFLSIPDKLLAAAGMIASVLAQALVSFIFAVAEYTPQIVLVIFDMIMSLITTLVTYTPQIVAAIFDLLIAMLNTITEKIPELALAMTNLIIALVNAVGENAPDLVDAGFKMMLDFIQGMSDTIMENNDAMAAVIKNFVIALLDTALAVLQTFLGDIPIVGDKIDAGIDGIRSTLTESYDADATKKNAEEAMEGMDDGLSAGGATAASTAQSVADEVEDNLDLNLRSSGKSATSGFVSGIKSQAYSSSTSSSLSSALSKIRSYFPFSPAKAGPFSGKGWVSYSGKSVMLGFAEGVEKAAPTAAKAVGKALETTSEIIDELSENVENGMELSPVITPVFDMSNVPSTDLTGGTLSLSDMSVPNINQRVPSVGNTQQYGNSYEIIINSAAAKASDLAAEVEKVIINRIERNPQITKKIVKNMTRMSNNQAKVVGA